MRSWQVSWCKASRPRNDEPLTDARTKSILLDAQDLSHRYDRDPIVQVPPFINYQMAAITERILGPLRHTTLKQLQDVTLAK
jgi:hypothetical protein